VRVLFDDRYLYVVARMHDPAPDSIVSLLSRRDVRTRASSSSSSSTRTTTGARPTSSS
jgi:hypothetical protein